MSLFVKYSLNFFNAATVGADHVRYLTTDPDEPKLYALVKPIVEAHLYDLFSRAAFRPPSFYQRHGVAIDGLDVKALLAANDGRMFTLRIDEETGHIAQACQAELVMDGDGQWKYEARNTKKSPEFPGLAVAEFKFVRD